MHAPSTSKYQDGTLFVFNSSRVFDWLATQEHSRFGCRNESGLCRLWAVLRRRSAWTFGRRAHMLGGHGYRRAFFVIVVRIFFFTFRVHTPGARCCAPVKSGRPVLAIKKKSGRVYVRPTKNVIPNKSTCSVLVLFTIGLFGKGYLAATCSSLPARFCLSLPRTKCCSCVRFSTRCRCLCRGFVSARAEHLLQLAVPLHGRDGAGEFHVIGCIFSVIMHHISFRSVVFGEPDKFWLVRG